MLSAPPCPRLLPLRVRPPVRGGRPPPLPPADPAPPLDADLAGAGAALRFDGAAADLCKHCVPAVGAAHVSIPFGRIDPRVGMRAYEGARVFSNRSRVAGAPAGTDPERPQTSTATGSRLIASSLGDSLTREERSVARRVVGEKQRAFAAARRQIEQQGARDREHGGRS